MKNDNKNCRIIKAKKQEYLLCLDEDKDKFKEMIPNITDKETKSNK